MGRPSDYAEWSHRAGVRVAVTGASGFLGAEVVRALAREGHEVRGLVRRPADLVPLSSVGATGVLGDVTIAASLPQLVDGCDQVIHLAQSGSGDIDARRLVRVDGCRKLGEAAIVAGARRLVVGSGYWVYRSSPDVITEESALDPRSISLVNHETELAAHAMGADGAIEVAVVRPGMVYGNGSWFRQMVHEIRTKEYRYVDDGANFLSPIHLHDLGTAFRTVVERAPAGETYIAVDDEPVTTRDFAAF
ncbi:MAG: NAD(P)H-binding protein, partial [Thermoplasmata archaeon]|nr:NAD(P)H-binding protein [Thermoplasmata archaeon]